MRKQLTNPATQLRTASTSISTFQRGSSRAPTTSEVLTGRTSAKQLAVDGADRREVGRVDDVDAGADDVVEAAVELGERGADDLEAAPGLHGRRSGSTEPSGQVGAVPATKMRSSTATARQ